MTIETAPRRTEYVPLDHLRADPANPKAHDTDAIDASIGRFGIIDQIVRDDRTGYIISGHGRDETLRRMRDRGDNPPEGVRIDAGGHWLIPVIVGWASRTDAEARAALIALNRTTELGGWVDDALLDLLDDLIAEGDHGLTGVGFTEADRDALAALADRIEDKETTRDLDALGEKYGEPSEEDTLRRLVLNLSPALMSQAGDALKEFESHDEAVTAWLGL
jgi:hypothetical protein